MFSSVPFGSIIVILVSMIISIPFHEAMHGYAARLLGDRTAEEAGRLTLNPLKHVDIWLTIALPAVLLLFGLPPIFIAKPVPFDPRNVRFEELGAALVGLAGPFSNLLLAGVAALGFRLAGLDVSGGAGYALALFIQVNIMLFVFNMIPLPPLDGSRLLYAFAPESLQRLMFQMETSGVGFIVLALLIFSGTLSPIISNVSGAIFSFLIG
jgi:Zn-dependent protease